MKILYIARHAKSERTFDKPDEERLITDVGVERTKKIGNILKSNNAIPQRIISSDAERAYTTSLVFADQLSVEQKNIETNKHFYLGSAEQICDEIKSYDNNIDNLMIVGHNPQFTEIANYFVNDVVDNLPTSGVVVINFDTDEWENIDKSNAELKFKIWPGML
ncbi:MAG: hypothetical protein PHP31_04555 [Lentimicrobiaceae bacterium]|nr:hypothetical protein [Lentimicrobiaceae bacterium]